MLLAWKRASFDAVRMEAAIALAHTGHAETTGLMYGLAHPISGIDHVLAMVAVGLLSAHLGGRALWLVPLTFVGVMMVGGALGMAGIQLPFAEVEIGLSVIVLGLAVAFRFNLPTLAAMALVGFFAVFHGYVHGVELPASASGLPLCSRLCGRDGTAARRRRRLRTPDRPPRRSSWRGCNGSAWHRDPIGTSLSGAVARSLSGGDDSARYVLRASLAQGAVPKHLLSRLERTIRASARLLHDLVRIDRTPQLGDAFDARACGSLRGNAGSRRRRAEFVGLAPGQLAFPRPEAEIAAARCDIDIADAANHGIRIDGNFRIRSKAESSIAAKQTRNDSLVESAHSGRMLRHHRGQRQGGRPGGGSRRGERSVLHHRESQCR
jgi:hydrogenase/urease accessory protein HupE